MRRTVLLLASAALAVGLLAGAYTSSGPTAAAQSTDKPNFVFILADDLRKDDLKYMPKTRNLLGDEGMTFQNAYVSNALCCPSRTTIMRGQYSHNSGVWTNDASSVGGWQAYKSRGHEQDNVATRLHDAGYRTALIGKYLNGYQGTDVPPGWDYWFGKVEPVHQYFDYDVNVNGTIHHFGTAESDYATDVIKQQTTQFISTSPSPFFAFVTATTPHSPYVPAPRDQHVRDGLKAPRSPSFNEQDVSDKPPWIRSLPRLTSTRISSIDGRYEMRAEMLQSLDDLVGGVVNRLQVSGKLSNTYIFFTSDNGWHHGEHRIPQGKWRPYEESIHMPLLVRGPDVGAGSTTAKLALNTDFLPTLTDLAGAQRPSYVDGRSLRPVIEGTTTAWRSAILLEGRPPQNTRSGYSPTYYGILRGDGRKYIEYAGGARELYDLSNDPYEQRSLHNSASADLKRRLASRLDSLKSCAAQSCRSAEN
jgi:N-acetylglucosamine-6-sulfatase